jgi:uncharacterized repeat protein (TIGR03803 family)
MQSSNLILAVAVGIWSFVSVAEAQVFTNLHSFAGSPGDGRHPQAGLIISGNTLYGTTESAGSSGSGTLFAVNTDGTGYTNLYNFTAEGGPNSTNSDGNSPGGTLVLSGNTLYGTAYYGGTNGNGTVFALDINGAFTALHSFSAGSGSFPTNYINSDGANPEAGLVLLGNTLYGTAEQGGSSGYGTIFAVNTNGTDFRNLYSFTNGSDGSVPGGLFLSGNTLYGATSGFPSGNGTVFKVNTNGMGFTTLHTFTGILSGGLLSGNTLFGTTYNGGSSSNGTVFALNTDGSGFTNVYSFTATSSSNLTNSEGANPIGGLILSGNTLYGTAYYGGSSGNGTVFAVNTNGTGFTTLYSFTETDTPNFTNSDGANPYGGMVLLGNTLYGTSKFGGSFGDGTVFSLFILPQLAITHSFANVVLTWPTNASGFTLQSTTNIFPPVTWDGVSPAPVVINGHNTVTNAIS